MLRFLAGEEDLPERITLPPLRFERERAPGGATRGDGPYTRSENRLRLAVIRGPVSSNMWYVPPVLRKSVFLLLGLSFLASSCGIPSALRERLTSSTPHERYRHALEESGLANTALGARWIAAADTALLQAETIAVPHREAGFFPAHEPRAVGWRVPMRRGRRLVVEVETLPPNRSSVFLDLFRTADGPDGQEVRFEHVATAESDGGSGTFQYRLGWTAQADGEVLVRLQPELLRDVAFEAVIRTEPTIAFPVDDMDNEAVRSGFGEPREAGRRRHEGVDIFAPRGTPVLAAAPGRVTRVGQNRLGGRVVWLRSGHGLSFYYAHLDTALVRTGARVSGGDTLGLVGNTGNARTTPPHLHFGVYAAGSGPVDPLPFLSPAPPVPPSSSADARRLEGRLRTTARARLRDAPSREGERLATLPRHSALEPVGMTDQWVRVRLAAGVHGWIHGSLVEEADLPVSRVAVAAGTPVRTAPSNSASVLRIPSEPRSAAVLGRAGDHLLVRFDDGLTGWYLPGAS